MTIQGADRSEDPAETARWEAEKRTDLERDRADDHARRDLLETAAGRAMKYHEGNGDTFHALLAAHFRASVEEGRLPPTVLALAAHVAEAW